MCTYPGHTVHVLYFLDYKRLSLGKQWKQCLTLFLGTPKSLQVDYSHEVKRHLLLGRKVVTNLDSILKSRDITLPTKVHLVKAMDVRVGL